MNKELMLVLILAAIMVIFSAVSLLAMNKTLRKIKKVVEDEKNEWEKFIKEISGKL